MGFQYGLDLFGENFLATTVDTHRAPPQQGNHTVFFHRGHIAGQRIANVIGYYKSFGGLFLILVVAQRYVSAAGQASDLPRPRHNRTVILIKHTAALADGKTRARPAATFHPPALHAGFGDPETIKHHD